MKKLAYVGIDYHLDFLAIAVVIEDGRHFRIS